MRPIIIGAVGAVVLAFVVAVPTLDGVSTWKYVLGAIGLVLFILGGRNVPPESDRSDQCCKRLSKVSIVRPAIFTSIHGAPWIAR